MPTCQNCLRKLKWKHAAAHYFTTHSSISCPYCGATQYPTAHGRKIEFGLTLLVLILVFTYNNVTGNSTVAVAAFIVALIADTMLHPFFLKLSNQKEKFF